MKSEVDSTKKRKSPSVSLSPRTLQEDEFTREAERRSVNLEDETRRQNNTGGLLCFVRQRFEAN